jgi:hypothetical protein
VLSCLGTLGILCQRTSGSESWRMDGTMVECVGAVNVQGNHPYATSARTRGEPAGSRKGDVQAGLNPSDPGKTRRQRPSRAEPLHFQTQNGPIVACVFLWLCPLLDAVSCLSPFLACDLPLSLRYASSFPGHRHPYRPRPESASLSRPARAGAAGRDRRQHVRAEESIPLP